MNNKRLFQVFDEMNVNDEKNKTTLLPCAFTMVEAKTAKGGGHVTMGVEAGIIQKLFLGEVQAVLVVFDKKEYHRLADEPVVDKLNEVQQDNNEWKAECDRLAKLVEYWQEKYNELNGPSFIPPKIDNNPIA
jgi:hypothetical protein